MSSDQAPPETDIMALMLADPLGHTEQDIDRIIAKFRSQRHAFNTISKAPSKKGGVKEPPQQLNLGDLSLD